MLHICFLKGPNRLLARLVDELLLGVLRLPLLGRVLADPRVHLGLQIRRELRVLVDHVLEIGGEVDLAGADARKRVERLGRQRRGAVLHGAAETVVLRAATRDSSSSVFRSIFTSVRTRAVGVDEPAVRGAGLHADLAQARRAPRRAS